MRIALVIEHLDPTGGGAERNCIELAHELAKRGHSITVLCSGCTEETAATLPGMNLEVGPGKPRNALKLWRFNKWITQRLDSSDFDVSLSFNMTAPATVLQPLGGSIHETLNRNIAMRPTAQARLIKRIAVALTPKQFVLRRLETQTLAHPRVAAIAALSQYVREQFLNLAVPDEKIHIIPNAVNLTPPTPQVAQAWRRKVRETFGIEEQTTTFVFSAYNPKLKGIAPLMSALKKLIDDGENVALFLSGGSSYAEQQLAEELGVRPHVKFIGLTKSMPALFAAADVTVHPTFYDPSSRVVIESLLMGTPAITTRYNGAADFIARNGHPSAGRVIDDPADISTLAQAMKELTDANARNACRNAMTGLQEQLTMQKHVDAIEALLQAQTHGETQDESNEIAS